MKKTLITLLALAGVAAADAVTIAPLTSSDGWTVGHQNDAKTQDAVLDTTAATLTLTSADWSRGYGVYTLADAITLTNEADSLTVSFTINTTDLNSLVTGTLVGSGKAITLGHGSYSDVDKNGGNGIQSGISTDTTGVFYNMQGSGTGGVFVKPDKTVDNSLTANTPLTLTTTVAWNTTKSQFVASLSYGETSLTSYDLGTSYTLDKLVFSLDGSSTQTVSGVSVSANIIPASPNVPEPTTATLSLLALCGLAARRRR